MVGNKTGNTRVITNLQASDLAGFRWLSDQRLVYTLYDAQRGLADQTGAGLFAIDRDGSNFREIYPLRATSDTSVGAYRAGAYVAKIPGTEDILVQAPQRSRRAFDILRIDTRTGQRSIAVDRTPGEVVAWVADQQGVPRAAVTDVNDQRRRFAVFLRDSAEAPWRKIAEYDRYEPEQFEPVAFDGDGSLLVITRAGGDKTALYRWDSAGNKLGERLVAELAAFPGEQFHARVARIADTVDPQTRTLRVRAEIPNTDGRLRPEMFGRIRHVEDVRQVPVVPIGGVIESEGQSIVFLETAPGTFRQQRVVVGERMGERFPVLSGVKPGDRVVSDGAMLLKGL